MKQEVHIIEFDTLLDLLTSGAISVLKLKVDDYYVYYTGTINAKVIVTECYISKENYTGYIKISVDKKSIVQLKRYASEAVRIREIKEHKQLEQIFRKYIEEKYKCQEDA